METAAPVALNLCQPLTELSESGAEEGEVNCRELVGCFATTTEFLDSTQSRGARAAISPVRAPQISDGRRLTRPWRHTIALANIPS